ncbi:MAG: RDD family protein [Promethearchaeota archaeon]
MSVRYCPHCGASIDDPSTNFCPSCGSAIGVTAPPTTEAPPPPPTAVPPPPSASEEQVVYAGFGERLLAYIIDVIILGVVGWIGIFAILGQVASYFGIWGLFTWLIAFLYFWVLESYNHGQTIGKLAMKIQTVDEYSHTPAQPGNLVINNLSRGLWWIIADFIIGILANRGDEQKRLRILQNLSKTVVIKAA